MTQKIKHNLRKIKDPGSAMTHFIAMVLAAAAAVPLLIKGSRSPEQFHLAALAVFILSMIGLYGASTIYHTLDISPKIKQLLRKVWIIAVLGIFINAFWITCPKWFSSMIYIAMGWVCILAFSKILAALPKAGFLWLLAGGIIYTLGGVIYALKLPIFNARHQYFGSHEIFHLFVMGGSLCHYMMMYQFVA